MMKERMNEWINESMNQSINQSINQSNICVAVLKRLNISIQLRAMFLDKTVLSLIRNVHPNRYWIKILQSYLLTTITLRQRKVAFVERWSLWGGRDVIWHLSFFGKMLIVVVYTVRKSLIKWPLSRGYFGG